MKKYDRPTTNPSYKKFNKEQKAELKLTQCTHYMSRKKRNCSHRVSGPGSQFCSIHEPENLRRLQQESLAGHEIQHATATATATANVSGVGKKRRRPRTSAPKRMVNPFSTFYSQTLNLPERWSDVFRNPDLPLTIDVGCARGTMLDKLADKHPDRNYLGIEIRPKLVEEALVRNKSKGNVYFLSGNFSHIEANKLMCSFADRAVCELVCFQFPDPWRKNRKQKRRRILQTELIGTLATDCAVGTKIYVSTDVKDLAHQMKETLDVCPQLAIVPNGEMLATESRLATIEAVVSSTTETASIVSTEPTSTENSVESHGWLNRSLLDVPSERELVCEQDWRPVWRICYVVKK